MTRKNKLGFKMATAVDYNRDKTVIYVQIVDPSPPFFTVSFKGRYEGMSEKQAIETAWIEYNYSL